MVDWWSLKPRESTVGLLSCIQTSSQLNFVANENDYGTFGFRVRKKDLISLAFFKEYWA
jgi:hypothetical protein